MTGNQEVAGRLKTYIKSKSMSVRAFEIACGFSNGWINALKEQIRLSAISSISLNFPDLNLNWLLVGNGPMLLEEKEKPVVSANDINNSVVFIGNWEGLEPIIEKAVNKVMGK